MTATPLLISGCYAPTVLRGRLRLSRLEIERNHEPFYRLVTVSEGVHEGFVAGVPFSAPPGGSYLLPPGPVTGWTSSIGSKAQMVAFTVAATRLIPEWEMNPKLQNSNVRHMERGAADQPDPEQVWGFPLGILFREETWENCNEQVRLIGETWWRSRALLVDADRRLGRLLHELYLAHRPEQVAEVGTGDDTTWVTRIHKLVEEHINAVANTTDLARLVGLSPGHFTRVFKQHMEETPAAYLRRKRLDIAKQWLAETDASVQSIANAAGYRSRVALEQAWKRNFELPPLQWRRQYKANSIPGE